MEFEKQDRVFRGNYFSVDIEDKIEFLKSIYSYANVNWISKGVETYLEYNVCDDTRVSISYSYSNADRERADDKLILHSPEGIVSMIIDQEFMDDKLKCRITGQHVGDRETWDGPTEAFCTMDISTSYQLNDSLKCWIRVGNILDEDYQEIRNYNGAPREVSAGFNFEW